ncbi:hypothetical protein FB645_005475 [Coemansia sp. IMI 203386]|nr:hypothetical protein FB645_005475 [Coemansia sp. IMI 203386]
MVHMPSVSIGQGWTPVLTNAANTPVVTGVSGSATMSVANGSLHTMSGIAPNLLVADINSSSRTSHFATHFPPLSSVSASQASISVSEYAAAAGNALFLPAGGHSSVGMPVAAGHGSGTATNAIGVVGLGIFGEIVPASHNDIDAAVSSSSSSSSSSSEAMSLYPAISGVQGMVDVRSYPFPATTEIHRPNGSLSFDMEAAAQLSDVAAKEKIIKGTEGIAAE